MFTLLSKSIMIAVIILYANIGYCSPIQSEIAEGNALFAEGNYESAVNAYQGPALDDLENPLLNYNLGTALYKFEDYPKAVEHLQKALLSEDRDIKNNGAFNLGNAYYKNGMAQAKSDLDFAIKALEKSIDQYQNILSSISKNADARVNKRIVEKELEKLKQLKNQQQENQQQDQTQNQKQNQQDSESQQKQDKQQNQQNQQRQDQKNNSGKPDQDHAGARKSLDDNDQQNQSRQQSQNMQQPQPQEEKDDMQQTTKNSSKQQKMNGPEGQSVRAGELTSEEAERLLNQYQQKEEPQGLLNFYISDFFDAAVIKDW